MKTTEQIVAILRKEVDRCVNISNNTEASPTLQVCCGFTAIRLSELLFLIEESE